MPLPSRRARRRMPDQSRQQVELRKLALAGIADLELIVVVGHTFSSFVIPVLVTGIRLASCSGAC